MWKRMIVTAMVMAAFASHPVFAFEPAQQGNFGPGMGHGEGSGGERFGKMKEHFAEIIGQLNLTPEQQQKLESSKNQKMEQGKKFWEDIKAKEELLRAELAKPELDMNKVNQLHSEIKALRNQKEDQRLNAMIELRQILTPEQFAKFNQLMQEKKAQWKEQKGTWKGGPQDFESKKNK